METGPFPHTPQCESTLRTIELIVSNRTRWFRTNLMFHSNFFFFLIASWKTTYTWTQLVRDQTSCVFYCAACVRLIFVSSLNRSLCHWGKNEKVPSLKLSWQIFFPLQLQRLSEPGRPAERRTVTCSTNSVTRLQNLLSQAWAMPLPFRSRLCLKPAAAQSTRAGCSPFPG